MERLFGRSHRAGQGERLGHSGRRGHLPGSLIGFRWTCLYDGYQFSSRRLQFKDAGFFQDIQHYGGARWITLSWSNTRGQRTWLQQNASHQDHGYEICLTGNSHAGSVRAPYLNARWIYLSDNYDHC